MRRPYRQVDVFSEVPFGGNPLAVVIDGTGLSPDAMQQFASWMNLSETTFLLPPTTSGADYLVRIFTPDTELPFAGHPTLGTCHTWLENAGVDFSKDVILQECAAGLIPVRRTPAGLAFAAPPLVRSGPVDEPLVAHIASQLQLRRDDILDAQWVDNGPGWVAVLLESAEAVLAVRPRFVDVELGVVGGYPPGTPESVELRAFVPAGASFVEDPVTGSLHASVAQWLLRTGRVRTPYTARQGTALGRSGRVHVSSDDDGVVWVAGASVTRIRGEVDL